MSSPATAPRVPATDAWVAIPTTLLGLTLGLWVIGVQTHEAIATVGAWLTALLVIILFAVERPRLEWRTWWPLPAFLGWAVIAPLIASEPPTATGLARLSDWLLIPVASYAVAKVRPAALAKLGSVAVVVLLISCAVAALQHYGVWPREEAMQSLAWTKLGFARVYEHVPGRDDRFMAGGLLFHRLKFANVSAVVVVLCVAAVVQGARSQKLLAGAVVGTLGVALFPHARAATVAMVLAVIVTWVLGAANRRRAVLGALGFAALVTLVIVATPSLRTRFAGSLTAEGSGDRNAITQAGLDAVAAHPLAGVGPGRFKPGLYAPADAPAGVREHQGKAHNQLVSLAAEAGLPAAAFALVLVVLLTRELWRTRPASVAGLGVMALFALLCALHDPLFHVESSLALMLALGGTRGFTRRGTPPSTPLDGEATRLNGGAPAPGAPTL